MFSAQDNFLKNMRFDEGLVRLVSLEGAV
jgi:hypothetical protein